jgi:hypothetical protein
MRILSKPLTTTTQKHREEIYRDKQDEQDEEEDENKNFINIFSNLSYPFYPVQPVNGLFSGISLCL